MLSKFSCKKTILMLTISLSSMLSACIPVTTTLLPTIAPTTTIQTTNTPFLTPTKDSISQKQELLDEISREIDEFNQLVEKEKLTGSIEVSQGSDAGQNIFKFTGESNEKIHSAHKNLISQIAILYDQYLALYKQDYNPTPFPTFNTKEEALNFYYESLQKNQDWLEEQKNFENALRIYDPDRGTYESFLNFEQSALLDLNNGALNKLRLDAELSPELLVKHQTIIEKLDGGSIETTEITSLPFYRNDMTFFQYQTLQNYYILNMDGVVIEIIPVDMPITETYTPVAPLTIDQLEEKARSFIKIAAPETDLDILIPAGGSKTGSFFFRWEDRTKPLLDDGQSYPFIQVGYNADGELLNYYNTLPLTR